MPIVRTAEDKSVAMAAGAAKAAIKKKDETNGMVSGNHSTWLRMRLPKFMFEAG